MKMPGDERMKKSSGEDHENRAMNDRPVVENRELSDQDRVDLFRQKLFQSALPDLPEIPGYHLCWLTTTNPRDSIQSRMRLGYELIKPEEVAGYEIQSMKTGEYAGYIAINEMVAAKLPMHLYQAYMRISHHDEPLREEGKLADTARAIAEQVRAAKGEVIEGDGIEALRKSVRAPMEF